MRGFAIVKILILERLSKMLKYNVKIMKTLEKTQNQQNILKVAQTQFFQENFT